MDETQHGTAQEPRAAQETSAATGAGAAQEPRAPEETSGVTVTRIGPGRLRAQAPGGAAVEFGTADGLLSPVELLLAALAGCMASTVEEPLSRAGAPEHLELTAHARHRYGPDGENSLADLALDAHLRLPAGPGGSDRTADRARRLLELAHERYCTVSRTLHHGAHTRLSAQIDIDEAAPGQGGSVGEP